ncbi:hypothetical protein NMG60_11006126 [Bertholletia excelsa]
MAAQLLACSNLSSPNACASHLNRKNSHKALQICFFIKPIPRNFPGKTCSRQCGTRCSTKPTQALKTCKNCKTQFDALLNHPRACRYHTAHFGGETKRKFESVYTGGTMNTPDSGKVYQYWHCCGSEDPFDPGCTAAPHASYDD